MKPHDLSLSANFDILLHPGRVLDWTVSIRPPNMVMEFVMNLIHVTCNLLLVTKTDSFAFAASSSPVFTNAWKIVVQTVVVKSLYLEILVRVVHEVVNTLVLSHVVVSITFSHVVCPLVIHLSFRLVVDRGFESTTHLIFGLAISLWLVFYQLYFTYLVQNWEHLPVFQQLDGFFVSDVLFFWLLLLHDL